MKKKHWQVLKTILDDIDEDEKVYGIKRYTLLQKATLEGIINYLKKEGI